MTTPTQQDISGQIEGACKKALGRRRPRRSALEIRVLIAFKPNPGRS